MTVTFLKTPYEVSVWDHNDPPMSLLQEDIIGVDTETEPIEKGKPVVPVIMQVCFPKARLVEIVPAYAIEWYLQKLFYLKPDIRLAFHSAAFDLRRLNWLTQPELVRAVEQGRVVDVAVQYLLKTSEDGMFFGRYSLDHIVKTLLKVTLSKEDRIRLSFRENQPLTEEQMEYAALDPISTVQCALLMPRLYPTHDIQLYGTLALADISERGFLQDPEYFSSRLGELEGEIQKQLGILDVFGFRPKEEGNAGVTQALLENLETRLGGKFPRTPKSGKISMIGDGVTRALGEKKHPFVEAYKAYVHLNGLKAKYFNLEHRGADGRAHPYFTIMVKTGRTSCSAPNLQNVPRDWGIRGIYIAAPGKVLLAVDYKQLELCALAEHCFVNYGRSTMGDKINEGADVHQWFGDQVRDAWGGSPSDGVDYRQMAKAANFGF